MIGLRSILTNKAALLASAILIAQGAIYYTGSGKEVIPPVQPWNQFPTAVSDWQTVADVPLDQDTLDKLRPDDYLNRNYATSNDRALVNFFVGYFNSRRNGRAPHSPEWCLPGAGWKSVSTRRIQIPIAGESGVLTANEYIIEKGLDREVVLYWYHQGTRSVAGDLMAQMYSLPDLIFHGRTDTALIRIIAPMQSADSAQAKQSAVMFAELVYPLVRRHIL
jgi:EpsI family protein